MKARALAAGCVCAAWLAGAAAEAEQPRPHSYMAFGDSISGGDGSSDELGYRGRLQTALRARFGDAAVVIDEGKPGADSRNGQRRIGAALQRHNPAATLVLLGTNDWAEPPREPASTANALRRIVREVKARHSRPYLATIPPVNVGFAANATAAREDWVGRANALIRALAREEDAVLVDLHAALAAAGPVRTLFADGVHPNDAGYAVIAEAFFQAIAGSATPAPSPAASPAALTALRFGKLWDGAGRTLTNAVVVVERDRIRSVEAGGAAPAGAPLVDLSAYTGLPGLIDAHTHVTYGPAPGGNRSPIVNAFLARDALRKTLEAGVTTVRDMNAVDYADVALRDLVEAGELQGPRIFAVGCGLRVTRTPFRGAPPPPACGLADGPEEVTRAARQQLAAGADWVKLFGSTGSGQDVTGFQTFTFEEIKAAADAVHAFGKRVAVHSYGPAGARDAARAGADSIEHATDMDDETIAEIARRGIYYLPTIDHNRWYAENGHKLGYAPGYKERLEDFLRRNLETARRAHKAGVRFVMGSDAIYTMFGENTRELGWFVQAGMSPEQALLTATRNAAQMLGQPDALGVVKPGAFADLVAVAGDPLADIGVLHSGVRFVMKGGRVVVDKTREH